MELLRTSSSSPSENLTRLTFEKKIPAVVRNGAYLTVFLRLFSNDRQYEGPVALSVLAASNHSQPTSDDTDLYELDVQLSRADLSNPLTVLTFVASNDVSSVQHKVNVTIAGECRCSEAPVPSNSPYILAPH